MTDNLKNLDFLLENADLQPPDMIMDQISPFKKAMNFIVWGCGLCSITLNFFALNYLLPAIGLGLILLGFRQLKDENRWFGLGYYLSMARTAICWAEYIGMSTVWCDTDFVRRAGTLLSTVNLVVLLGVYFALWRALLAVQRKAGFVPHAPGAAGLIIWYGIIIVFVLVGVTDWLTALILLAVYVLMICSLVKTAHTLDTAGFAAVSAPQKCSNKQFGCVMWGVLAAGIVLGYIFGSSYPMNWQPYTENQGAADIRDHLLNLGFPTDVLNDIADDDLEGLEHATLIMKKEHYYGLDDYNYHILNGQEGDSDYVSVGIGVQYFDAEGRQCFRLYHYFQWLNTPTFYGTECIQLWPAYRLYEGWFPAKEASGKLMYADGDFTKASDYYQIGDETYTSSNFLMGSQVNTDTIATFSFPNGYGQYRGYICYDVVQASPGMIVDGWINYTHQQGFLRYPAITSRQHRLSGAWDNRVFDTIQDAIQFYPSDQGVNWL